MDLVVDNPAAALASLRFARQQCQTRSMQLAACRVCDDRQAEFEQAIKLLKDLERQLEVQDVQPVPT